MATMDEFIAKHVKEFHDTKKWDMVEFFAMPPRWELTEYSEDSVRKNSVQITSDLDIIHFLPMAEEKQQNSEQVLVPTDEDQRAAQIAESIIDIRDNFAEMIERSMDAARRLNCCVPVG